MTVAFDKGSTVVETVFALWFLCFMSLGVVQIAFTLYARNVVVSSAHEGARAAVELGRTVSESELVARRTVLDAAGGMVEDLEVEITKTSAEPAFVEVSVTGRLDSFGPLPVSVPVSVTTRSELDEAVLPWPDS